jgi:hypothetical protein
MQHRRWTIQALCGVGLLVVLGCTNTTPLSPVAPARLGTSEHQATIHALHRKLHERERTIATQHYQIEVMSSQLEALRRIDQDTRESRRRVRQ